MFIRCHVTINSVCVREREREIERGRESVCGEGGGG